MTRIAAVFLLLLFGAAARAGEIDVREKGGRLAIHAKDAPAGELLDRLRGRVNLIFDAGIATRVTLDMEGLAPADAVRRVAEAAGLIVEEVGDRTPIFLVRKPRPAAPSLPPIEEKGGAFFAKQAFAYPVLVLRETPEDCREKEALSRFEATKGISLLSAPDLEARVIRDYLEAREIYRAIAERAGVPLPLGSGIDERHVRLYVDTENQDRAFAEILFDGERGELIHLVYELRGKTYAVVRLTMFRKPIR
jgi:hypothetical protein